MATGSCRASQDCEAPLERFRVRVEGTAAAHADHSDPLHKVPGEPVEIAIDLTWTTDGTPYQWRLATRYEIPCRVSGTVRVGDEQFELSGPGQRDHSWGARDWWASDWMWSALHLEDGTHTHAVGVPQGDARGRVRHAKAGVRSVVGRRATRAHPHPAQQIGEAGAGVVAGREERHCHDGY